MVFFPEGDKARGMALLEESASGGGLASTEASYFLLQILFNFEQNHPRAYELAGSLHREFPDNPVFHRYRGRAAAALSLAEADSIFGEILSRAGQGRTGYGRIVEREARYYVGAGLMRTAQLEEALGHFYRCDELSRKADASGSASFMALANLRIGMIYDLQGKRELAVQQYEKVLDMDDTQSVHERARKYIAEPYHGS
jgi:tetratricopeptide (TPR) repeat protein